MLKAGTPEWSTQGRIRNAAKRALEAYPGPVGELLARELDAYAELAFLWVDANSGRRMRAIVDELLGATPPAARESAGGVTGQRTQ